MSRHYPCPDPYHVNGECAAIAQGNCHPHGCDLRMRQEQKCAKAPGPDFICTAQATCGLWYGDDAGREPVNCPGYKAAPRVYGGAALLEGGTVPGRFRGGLRGSMMSRYYDEATGERSAECMSVMGRCYVGVEGIALTPQLILDRSFVSFELARLERERDEALRTVAGLERMARVGVVELRFTTNAASNCPTLADAVAAWVAANPEGK